MPSIPAVIVSIALVTTARLQRRTGANPTRGYERNRPRWLGGKCALGVPWRAVAACVLLLAGLATE
jgi:hypothetical protein